MYVSAPSGGELTSCSRPAETIFRYLRHSRHAGDRFFVRSVGKIEASTDSGWTTASRSLSPLMFPVLDSTAYTFVKARWIDASSKSQPLLLMRKSSMARLTGTAERQIRPRDCPARDFAASEAPLYTSAVRPPSFWAWTATTTGGSCSEGPAMLSSFWGNECKMSTSISFASEWSVSPSSYAWMDSISFWNIRSVSPATEPASSVSPSSLSTAPAAASVSSSSSVTADMTGMGSP